MYLFDHNRMMFPHPRLSTKAGVLAYGGILNADVLFLAYNFGIFPWYNPDEPIIWWNPRPRYIIVPEEVKVSKSMRSYFNQNKYTVTYNQEFSRVIEYCRKINRKGQQGTWIDDDIVNAYTELHHRGYAMSVEVWEGKELVGGLYGVILGRVFFGESMFALRPNASKFGFITLARKLSDKGFILIDCQQPNPHLDSLGGRFIHAEDFEDVLRYNRTLTVEMM
jgi:leucyl/phenylalanyl-tRNA---protein transferase